jgi:oligosaccharide repeat unit polymerase
MNKELNASSKLFNLIGTFIISVILGIAFIGLIIGGEAAYSRNIFFYPTIGFIIILISVLNILRIKFVDIVNLSPSFLTLSLFLIIPPIGYLGYLVFIKVYGCYNGGKLYFEYPFFLWYLGSAVFAISVLSTHIMGKQNRTQKNSVFIWDIDKLNKFLFLFVSLSTIFTIIAIFRIGYIPIFKGGIDVERFTYSYLAGNNIIKFSRLWLIVALIATHLLFLTKKRWYALILIISLFCLVIYGQRQFALIATVYFFLIRMRYVKRIEVKKLIAYAIVIILIFYCISYVRGFKRNEFKSLSLGERILFNTFGEWREYSYVVNKFNNSKYAPLREKLYLGAVVAPVPEVVFTIFGVNKRDLYISNASDYFGRYFGHYAGIRIGIIGESYIGLGLTGIFIFLIFLGLVFAFLETNYLSLEKTDPRLVFSAFLLSILVFLPLLT